MNQTLVLVDTTGASLLRQDILFKTCEAARVTVRHRMLDNGTYRSISKLIHLLGTLLCDLERSAGCVLALHESAGTCARLLV